MTLTEAKAENDKMHKELDDNPDIRHDEKWIARRTIVKQALEAIMKENPEYIA